MAMKTTKFNAFDYFESDDEILDYLSDCFNDDDPQLFVTALSHLIEKKGVAEVAKLTGLNRESLYKTVKGRTQPTWATVHKIIHALKIQSNFAYA
ncbi:putative addiction module antidote protein [Moraxella lacunata]|uniref:Putative addiction module antidote protein n=2 Tax=Moraxella lacunata TaxID=477 RepID=A0A1V4GT84_MORLA|nr:putative addiction module antidote protein [Moraxella lacunata]